MFFILSKLLIYFLYPITWIVTLLVIALFIKNIKVKKKFLIATIVILYIFSNTFLLNQFARFWDVPATQLKGNQQYSCALVLGGFVSEDQFKNGFLNWSSDRFIQAIKLQEDRKVSHLLFTGGNASLQPDGFIEANWIKSEVKKFQLADSSILFEKRSRNTIENIQFSKIILQAQHLLPPYLMVTSGFHMRRALLICKKANLQVIPYSCNFFAGKSSTLIDDFIPSALTLANWNIYLKEVVGYSVTYLKTNF